MMPYAIVIPALNPDERLIDLAEELRNGGEEKPLLIIVNDGSGEKSFPVFQKLADIGCTVLRHSQNRGKGAALKTAFRFIAENYPDISGCVTADADCQHTPGDIRRVKSELINDAGEFLILGVRDFSGKEIPVRSRFGNRLTASVFRLITGVKCSDTQTGLRGIPRKYIPLCAKIPGERFEYEMNMLLYLSRELPFLSVPIETLYEEKNIKSHFRPMTDSLIIYAQIINFSLSAFFRKKRKRKI